MFTVMAAARKDRAAYTEKKGGEDLLTVFFSVTTAVELTEDYRDPGAEAVENEDKKVHKTAGYSHRGKGIGAEKPANDQRVSSVVELL